MTVMEIVSHTLVGRFATLEPLKLDHIPALWDAGQHDEIWSYMPVRPRSLSEMSELVTKFVQHGYREFNAPFAIVDSLTNVVVGSSQILDITFEHRRGEIGWTWLSPTVWRTAINTECKLLLLSYCFEELGLIRVQLKTDLRNTRSQAAIERLGAVREGVLRKHRILSDGYVRDSVYYSITDDEWPIVKASLIERLSR